MATAADTFQRKEKKYLLSADQCAALKQALATHMRLDDYGLTQIDSLYIDTPNRDLIARSIEKPLYKEKMRVRSYGAFDEASTVYIEIKKKFKGIVYKRRVRMSAEGAKAYLAGKLTYEQAHHHYPVTAHPEDDLSPGKVQIAHEIDAFLDRYGDLRPSMLISCKREAWCPLETQGEDCVDRITFDEDVTYTDLDSKTPHLPQRVTEECQVIMEIKCAGGYPLWLVRILDELGVYPQSFSKYGTAYRKSASTKLELPRKPLSQPRREQALVAMPEIKASRRRLGIFRPLKSAGGALRFGTS